MKRRRNWVIGIALSATASFVALQSVNAPNQENQTTLIPDTVILITETSTPAYEGCAFTWASHDSPELTKKLDGAVKEISLQASATATLFGEDCVYADGSSTFGVMETNFTIQLSVNDLTKHEEFGNWIKDVMQIILEIPLEEIQGNYGFVEFWFEKTESENIILRVPIQKYVDEAKDKTGLELFNYFYQL